MQDLLSDTALKFLIGVEKVQHDRRGNRVAGVKEHIYYTHLKIDEAVVSGFSEFYASKDSTNNERPDQRGFWLDSHLLHWSACISASILNACCRLDEVGKLGEMHQITQRGNPVAVRSLLRFKYLRMFTCLIERLCLF